MVDDPEILDPERAGDATSAATSGGVEKIVAAVQRVLPGRAVKVDVEQPNPARPRSLFQTGPRFRIEADGDGGPLVVESGPLFSLTVSFRSARFGFDIGPAGPGLDKAIAGIVDRVRALARDEIVVLEEQRTARVMRTTVLRVDGGRIVEELDSGILPNRGDVGPAALASFGGSLRGTPTRDQQRAIDKLGGGVLGKMKRRIAEKVFSAAATRLTASFEKVAEERAAAEPDDGRRKLGR